MAKMIYSELVYYLNDKYFRWGSSAWARRFGGLGVPEIINWYKDWPDMTNHPFFDEFHGDNAGFFAATDPDKDYQKDIPYAIRMTSPMWEPISTLFVDAVVIVRIGESKSIYMPFFKDRGDYIIWDQLCKANPDWFALQGQSRMISKATTNEHLNEMLKP